MDSQFPTGGYAHSGALEEVVRLGVVRDAATFERFLAGQLVPSLLAVELPFARMAHAAAGREEVERLAALDREVAAWKPCRELREASRATGERRFRMLRELEPCELLERCERELPWKHHAVVIGLQGREAPVEAVSWALLVQAVAGSAGAAIKLLRIGQGVAQGIVRRVVAGLGPALPVGEEPGGAGAFTPMIDLASMMHERAEERLFIS
jgi:urease accessory protein